MTKKQKEKIAKTVINAGLLSCIGSVTVGYSAKAMENKGITLYASAFFFISFAVLLAGMAALALIVKYVECQHSDEHENLGAKYLARLKNNPREFWGIVITFIVVASIFLIVGVSFLFVDPNASFSSPPWMQMQGP